MVLQIIASIIIPVLSLLAIAFNSYFIKQTLFSKKYTSAYYFFSRARSMGNIATAFCFLLWAVPSTILGHIYVNQLVNELIGQLVFALLVVGPLTQLVISANLFIHFLQPQLLKSYNNNITKWGSLVAIFTIGCMYYVVGFAMNCPFSFNTSIFSFAMECQSSLGLNYVLFVTVTLTSATAYVFNMCSLAKAYKFSKTSLMTATHRHRLALKDRKHWQQLIMNCVQDALYVAHVYCITWVVYYSDSEWYQFSFNTFTWLLVLIADGALMILSDRQLYTFGNGSTVIAVSYIQQRTYPSSTTRRKPYASIMMYEKNWTSIPGGRTLAPTLM